MEIHAGSTGRTCNIVISRIRRSWPPDIGQGGGGRSTSHVNCESAAAPSPVASSKYANDSAFRSCTEELFHSHRSAGRQPRDSEAQSRTSPRACGQTKATRRNVVSAPIPRFTPEGMLDGLFILDRALFFWGLYRR